MRILIASLLATAAIATPAAATNLIPGNLVVSVEGNGVYGATSGSYTDNQAAPLTLFQFSHNGTSSASYLNSIVLPQTSSGTNNAISGEYGSSSEGTLQLTADGKHLVIMGYGVNAATYNTAVAASVGNSSDPYGNKTTDPTKPTALGQSGSLTGQAYTPVARVVAVIGANGSVDTSTALFNVFNGNNPRSVASVDGKTFYVSGQGVDDDQTAGVYYATLGSHSATAITGKDAAKSSSSGNNETQDTRIVQIHDNQLYVSTDTKGGKNSARDYIGTLGTIGELPTSVANGGNGPAQLPGFGDTHTGQITIDADSYNGLAKLGSIVNLSPEQYFFADADTLYVADSGAPKNDSGETSKSGDGGLQKWILDPSTGQWSLAYTLSDGLNLVKNSASSGTTGLLGLTGEVVDGQVELFATNYTVGDTDQTYLFGITDLLSQKTLPTDESFNILATAPADSNFKGVSFAPSADTSAVPEPASWALMLAGFGLVGGAVRRSRRDQARVATA